MYQEKQNIMKEIKIRIVKKSKEGVLLSQGKGREPMSLTWDEFKKGYNVKDDVWAVPTEETIKKAEELNKHINSAVTAFFLNGAGNGTPDPVYLMMLGDEFSKIQELADCTGAEAMQMVQERINMVRNGFVPRKFHKSKPKKENKPVTVAGPTSGMTFGDLDVLKELKAKMEKE